MASDASPFDTMTVAEYHTLIQGTLEKHDVKGTSAALQVMALYHPIEAERARQSLLHGIHLSQTVRGIGRIARAAQEAEQ